MIPAHRQRYNAEFTPEKYRLFLADIENTYHKESVFRVAETPIFVPHSLKQKMIAASEHIIDQILEPDFGTYSAAALHPEYIVPNETPHSHFICIDFAVCRDEKGELSPQLIELQGCASLFCFQHLAGLLYRKHFYCPDNFNHLFGDLDNDGYLSLLKQTILGQHKPENVILLEIKPHEQKTRIDFYATQGMLGIRPTCVSEIIREGRQWFYINDQGQKTPIYRVYNRVIFEDFAHYPDLSPAVLLEESDVEWVGHPNWFFRISKHTMPLLDDPCVPKSRFLSDFREWPSDLENYVLKPLFSFAGTGIIIDVKQEDLAAIPEAERGQYLLQRKVKYEPVIDAPNEPVKVELRMMYVWPDKAARPTLVTNLGRMSKGSMIGVRYNANKDWVGGTMGFFENSPNDSGVV